MSMSIANAYNHSHRNCYEQLFIFPGRELRLGLWTTIYFPRQRPEIRSAKRNGNENHLFLQNVQEKICIRIGWIQKVHSEVKEQCCLLHNKIAAQSVWSYGQAWLEKHHACVNLIKQNKVDLKQSFRCKLNVIK